MRSLVFCKLVTRQGVLQLSGDTATMWPKRWSQRCMTKGLQVTTEAKDDEALAHDQ